MTDRHRRKNIESEMQSLLEAIGRVENEVESIRDDLATANQGIFAIDKRLQSSAVEKNLMDEISAYLALLITVMSTGLVLILTGGLGYLFGGWDLMLSGALLIGSALLVYHFMIRPLATRLNEQQKQSVAPSDSRKPT